MQEVKKDTIKKIVYGFLPFVSMGILFLLVQVLSIRLGPIFDRSGLRATTTPSDPLNFLPFIIFILLFTLVAIIAIRKGIQILVQAIILIGIMSLVFYVLSIFISTIYAGVIALLTAITVFLYPKWYIIDLVGIVSGAGAAGIFGASFSPLPSIIFLVVLGVYDYIAVYTTGHMVSLAESIMEGKMPVVFVVPKNLKYSLEKGGEDALVMGLGDAVMPSVLVASASVFMTETIALGVIVGSLSGFSILMYMVSKGKAHAGLPLLNGGAIAGFIIFSFLFS